MRKILLATTALAAVSVASGAVAQESQMMTANGNTLNIGGYYDFGWRSLSDDHNGVLDDANTYGESELFIDFENTADNGLTYGVQIDLEVVNGGNFGESGDAKNAEESSIYVRGDFGEVHFGHDDGAYGRMILWAPTHAGTFSQDDAPAAHFLMNNTDAPRNRHRVGTNLLHVSHSGVAYGDTAKITYVSPSFNGFKFAASVEDADGFAKDTAQPVLDANNSRVGGSRDNAQSFGASFGMDLGGGTMTVNGASWSNNADKDLKITENQLGVKYARGAFTVTLARAKNKSGNLEKEATQFGIGFKVSDELALGASHNSAEATLGKVGDTGYTDEEGTYQSLSGKYTIAPGLTTSLALNQFEVESKSHPLVGAATVSDRADNSGSSIVWEVRFTF